MPRSTTKISAAVRRRAARIRLLLMDVDGTLTDGHVWLLSQPDGTALELKSFNAQDGQGLTLAAQENRVLNSFMKDAHKKLPPTKISLRKPGSARKKSPISETTCPIFL